jgi:hypothetical protein
MSAVTHWIKVDGKPFPKPAYACIEAGCNYLWDSAPGFYSADDSEPISWRLNLERKKLRLQKLL